MITNNHFRNVFILFKTNLNTQLKKIFEKNLENILMS